MIYLMIIPGIIINYLNYLVLTDNIVTYPKPMAVIIMIMYIIPVIYLIFKGIKKTPSLDGFGGYILALIFGTKIMGKLEPGQIRILHEAKGNPFAEDDFDNYVKVIDIKNGYVKYARYSKHTNEFTYILTNDSRTFMYMYPIATTNLDKFT
jgi:hypothetical protein